MSTLPQIRKNIKFFANGKNKPLVLLATMVADAEEALAVYPTPQPSEHNTCLKVRRDLHPLLPTDSYEVPYDRRYHERNIMYDRMDIEKALGLEFESNENGSLEIAKDVQMVHPITVQALIAILNNKYGYDITEDDITITYVSGVTYTLTARPNSLQFTGQATIDVGEPGDEPPPVKTPSHDSVWDATIADLTKPFTINGNQVDPTNLQAMHQAGAALVQFDQPDMAWFIWLSTLAGEASFQTNSPSPRISNANVNQTLAINDGKLTARYVSFTPIKLIPEFINVVTVANLEQTAFFTVPYAATLDRMITVWVDNIETSISNLLKPEGVAGIKLTIENNGDAKFVHDGVKSVRLQMRVNIATIPALVRVNSRFIYGIQRGGINLPMDTYGHEVYNLTFPKKEEVVPDPSAILPVIPTKSDDYIAALNRNSGGLELSFANYQKTNPYISLLTGNRYQLSATVESETNEARYPAFYFITEKDWTALQNLPINTKIGTYTRNGTPPETFELTVGTLTGIVTPVAGGQMFCLVQPIPLHENANFVIDYDPAGNKYRETTTLLRFEITYSRASIITPKAMNYDILRRIAGQSMESEAIDRMVDRQLLDKRFINLISGQWSINYEFAPYNPPPVLDENSLDDNGLYVLQLMAIPTLAITQIQSIAAREPTTIILRLTDTGGKNPETYTAMEIIQQTILDSNGDGYLCLKHFKQNASRNVRWTFVCDYDGADLTYRQTTTIVNITDSIIDNPGIPFEGLSIQEAGNEAVYNTAVTAVKAAYDKDFYTYAEAEFFLAANSKTGTFTRYGLETPAKYTVGRVLFVAEQKEWLRTGDFTQFPEQNPVIIRVTNNTTAETFDVKLDYIRANIDNPNGLPILMPMFDDENRVNTWVFDFKFFGFGNPTRPAPSPLPNLKDGSITSLVTCKTLPYKTFDSLFNFTSDTTAEEKTAMRNRLFAHGIDIPITDEIVTNYTVLKGQDTPTPVPPKGNNAEAFYIDISKQTPTFKVLRVIDIDPEILAAFMAEDFPEALLSHVVFKRTAGAVTGTDQITVADIRATAVSNVSKGLVPVVGELTQIENYQDPKLPSQTWVADFSILSAGGNVYVERTVVLSSRVHTDGNKQPKIDLKGITGVEFPDVEDILTLAKAQWTTHSFSDLEDLNIVSNNNFGEWNVKFINKGHFGFEVLEFSDDALAVLDTAINLGIVSNVATLNVTSIDSYNVSVNYTPQSLRDALKGGRYLTVPVKAAVYRGDYEIKINWTFGVTGTTTIFSPVSIKNTTTVKDGTPPDITVDAKWIVPTTVEQLNDWNGAVGLSQITLEQYGMSVTRYHYTHTVTVDQSTKEYVAAVSIDKTVRERLIENRYPDATIVGLWNSNEITAGMLIDGLRDDDDNSLLLVRAPINLETNRFPLSFSVSGIADYTQIFTGTDVPVVQVSDVLTTEIQNDFTQVITNLRTALNPLADKVINPADVALKTVSENSTTIVNTLNDLSRDKIGKTWVIPVGINKKQLTNITPGSWLIVRCNNGLEVSINNTDLAQFESEGWTYKKGETEYVIYPIMFVIADRTDVFKQTFRLTAGMSVGRWAPWFTNYVRTVNLEYSIIHAKETLVEALVPYTEDAALKASGKFLTYMDTSKFTTDEDTNINLYGTLEDLNQNFPIFVRWSKEQVDSLPDNDFVLGTVAVETWKDVDGESTLVETNTTPFTKADIVSGAEIAGQYYKLVGRSYAITENEKQVVTATFDYDGNEDIWVSGTSTCTAEVIQVYPVACVASLPYSGMVTLDGTLVTGSSVTFLDHTGKRVTFSSPTEDQIVQTLKDTFGLEAVALDYWEAD